MLSAKIQDAFNKHLNEELYSAYLYLSMSAYLESANLRGFANWMRVQAQEEVVHAMKFYQFIHDRDGVVTLRPIEGPPVKWNSPTAAVEDAYKHECKVTRAIGELVEATEGERDHAANAFLQWFVNEQVEEEATAKNLVDDMKFVGDNPSALFLMDQKLAARAFTMPTAAG